MKREKQIQVESHRTLNKESIPDNNYIAFKKGFCIGAKWADNNPSQQALAKELHRLGYAITLNGDIISKAEENKKMERYVIYQKNKLIEKACEWLKDNIYDYYTTGDGGDEFEGWFDDMFEDFKKAMEE